MRLKGKQQSVHPYRVLGRQATPGRLRGVAGWIHSSVVSQPATEEDNEERRRQKDRVEESRTQEGRRQGHVAT